MKLLTTGNPKIAKGLKLGYLTNILHLAPARMSGYNVCPMATAGCEAVCLNTAGRGGLFTGKSHLNMTGADLVSAVKSGTFTNAIQLARIARTKFFFERRDTFMAQLYKEIKSAIKLAKLHNLTPVFRLNGTSDLRWETFSFSVIDEKSVKHFTNIMAAFPSVSWYDYTKLVNRRNLPSNYSLTFSKADGNDTDVTTAIENGMNVAVVFRSSVLPTTYLDLPVINGDESDLRFLDPKGVIVGLKAKGKARHDTSGFVVDV